MDEMTLEEFKKYCEKTDYNVLKDWSKEHFKIVCNKCNSEDTIIFHRDESGCMGSEYTGYMKGFNHNEGIIVKCKGCGNAMSIVIY